MTEADWLACDDPQRMLAYLDGASTFRGFPSVCVSRQRASERKLRLFACACATILGASNPEAYGDEGERIGNPVECATVWSRPEVLIPGHVRAALLRDIVGNPWRTNHMHIPFHKHSRLLTPTVTALARAAYEERGRECERCRGSGEKDWLESWPKCPDCRGAGRIDDRTLDPQRLLVLSDALEEAGCDSEDILRHLRGQEWCPCRLPAPAPEAAGGQQGTLSRCDCDGCGWRPMRGPHVRGCWALDLLLGKE